MLISRTTTPRDHRDADRLSQWAIKRPNPLAEESTESYGKAIIQAVIELESWEVMEITTYDFKLYKAGGFNFAIARAEMKNQILLTDNRVCVSAAFNSIREQRGLDFAMLMVTDVVGNSSRFILVNTPPILNDFPFAHQQDGTLRAYGVVSLKKQ
jgi:manganese-dependent inorganic pyrophosphatase